MDEDCKETPFSRFLSTNWQKITVFISVASVCTHFYCLVEYSVSNMISDIWDLATSSGKKIYCYYFTTFSHVLHCLSITSCKSCLFPLWYADLGDFTQGLGFAIFLPFVKICSLTVSVTLLVFYIPFAVFFCSIWFLLTNCNTKMRLSETLRRILKRRRKYIDGTSLIHFRPFVDSTAMRGKNFP